MIKSFSDIVDAYENGQWHLQRFTKNAGIGTSVEWCDPTYSGGQPPYDAHVGTPGEFVPCIATKNKAIYFPDIPSGQTRHLVSVEMAGVQATFNGPQSCVFYDLLGYYPLVDGDITDEQVFDNTLTLPRYTDGIGVGYVIINHVAIAAQSVTAIVKYIDDRDVLCTVQVRNQSRGLGLVSTGTDPATSTLGAIVGPLASGSKGVKRIVSVTYPTAPGGLHAYYLVKILGSMQLGDQGVHGERSFITNNGFLPPRIYDGAWINFFYRIGAGTARTVTLHGHFEFVWG